jgi:hypothetical protein
MGLAEISSLDLFKCEGDHNLLDSSATVMLLGSALTGLGLVRHYLKREFSSPEQESRHFAASVHKLLFASDHCTSGAFGRPWQ